jgi:hypothetical protein
MDASKTRIYRGGLAGLIGASERESAELAQLTAADERPPAPHTSQVPPTPAQSRTLTGLAGLRAPPSALHATRIMPIEKLLPGHVVSPPTAAELRAAKADRQAGARLRTRRAPRFLGHVLVAVLTLLAVAVWRLPLTDRAPAGARRVVAVPIASPPPTAASMLQAELTPPSAAKPATPEPHTTPRPGLERAAVDAVVAGDYARAGELYRELARAQPASPVFAAAVRILAARAHSQL